MTYSFIALYILPSHQLDIHTETVIEEKERRQRKKKPDRIKQYENENENDSIKHTKTIWDTEHTENNLVL